MAFCKDHQRRLISGVDAVFLSTVFPTSYLDAGSRHASTSRFLVVPFCQYFRPRFQGEKKKKKSLYLPTVSRTSFLGGRMCRTYLRLCRISIYLFSMSRQLVLLCIRPCFASRQHCPAYLATSIATSLLLAYPLLPLCCLSFSSLPPICQTA